MERVLITGGSGFIGRATARLFCENGFEVRILDLNDFPDPLDLDYVQGDIRDIDICKRSVSGCSRVIHLAAMSRSAPSTDEWRDCLSTNIDGTTNVLEAALTEGVHSFVYAGSSTFYGNQLGPQTPSMAPDLLNFYGLSKYVGEEIVRRFSNDFGLRATVLRYFNVYGPGQPTVGPYGLVMGIFLSAKKAKSPVVIHGNGLQSRDFVFVEDVARANLIASGIEMSGKTFNIGSGTKTSILELARLLDLNFEFGPARQNDAAETWADISVSNRDLNWRPLVSLVEGLAFTQKSLRQESN
jgi:UDP-glucose 4-epimerase